MPTHLRRPNAPQVGGIIPEQRARSYRNRRAASSESAAITVALSLYGEINLLRGNIAALANGIGVWFQRIGYHNDDLPGYYREMYSLREPTLYAALAPKLGLLHPDILLPVTKFYSDYEAAKDHFPKLFKSDERGLSYGIEWVLNPAIRAVKDVEGAIRRIEQIGKIETPAETPNCFRAEEAVILSEELMPEYEG